MATRFDGVLSLQKLGNFLVKISKIQTLKFSIVHSNHFVNVNFDSCVENYLFVNIVDKELLKVDINEISIGDIVIETSLFGIFDLQTPFIVVDTELFYKLYEFIHVFEDCSNLNSLPALTFKLSMGEIVLTPDMYVLHSIETNECLLGISYLDFPLTLQHTIIIGGFAKHPYDICFDIENMKIGVSLLD